MKPSVKNFVRYHYEVSWPKNVGEMCLSFFEEFKRLDKVQTTFHSANQLMDERNGTIPLPTLADLLHPQNTLVEIYEILDDNNSPSGVIQKVLVRAHHLDECKDYSYVISRDGFLVSAWTNSKTDIHRLINRDLYWSDNYNENIEVPDALK